MSFVLDRTVLKLEIELQATEISSELKMKIKFRCEPAGRILVLFQDFRFRVVSKFSQPTCGLDHLSRLPLPCSEEGGLGPLWQQVEVSMQCSAAVMRNQSNPGCTLCPTGERVILK